MSNDKVTKLLNFFHRYTVTVQSHLWNFTVFKYNIIPNFSKINIPNISPASKFMQHKAYILRLKYEIKYLYIKKHLNQHLLKLHLLLANSQGHLYQHQRWNDAELLKQ